MTESQPNHASNQIVPGDRVKREFAELQARRLQIAEHLEGLKDWQLKTILQGMVNYGWRRPNGEWHDSPFYPQTQHNEV